MGYVLQTGGLFPFLSVRDNIGLSRQGLGLPVKEAVEAVAERLGIGRHLEKLPRQLSVGERQRVAMASVMVARPEVLILDEPTRGMEHRLKSELMRLLEEYRRGGNTVVLVTHDVETVAEYADRVVLLSEGRVIVDGDKRDVLSRALFFSPQINRLVQAFEKYGVPNDILTVDEAMGILK